MTTIELNAQASLSGKAKAEITSQISISDNSGLPGGTTLNFGSLAVSTSTSGTCTLSTSNIRTTSGGVNAISTTTSSTASFLVNGTMNKAFAITLPAIPVVVTRAGGIETMTVDNFQARPMSSGSDQTTGTLDATGTDSFFVGGRLNIAAAQVDGVYEGTFNVTVAYN
ncbi:MAG: hypothetical protein AUK44_02465 [Porphyromonadaceae bacterium CG2_30_38_12]|nr:MAG: hypothetical protein AUK44_02465 [Porphyromonadaceae bacterium CG2_30_38_12]